MELDVEMAERTVEAQEPLLRFYRWRDPTVTAGRTVREDVAFGAMLMYPGSLLVRRPTGGGLVFHGEEMSFSLAWPRSFAALRDLRHSYCAIHAAVQRALRDCGVDATQATESDADAGVVCSQSTVAGDLVGPSGKMVGGAQWRGDGFVLYQGHLWLRWMPAIEEAIACSLADMLRIRPQQTALSADDFVNATERAERWRISPEPLPSA